MATIVTMYLSLVVSASAHGAMTKPVPRNGFKPDPTMDLNHSGCTLPHEPAPVVDHQRSHCYEHMSWFCGTIASSVPCHTLPGEMTLPIDMSSAPIGFVWPPPAPTIPWRNPGVSVPASPCGVQPATLFDGKDLPKTEPREVWYKGSNVVVGHSIAANHGGGYSWRICPDTAGSLDDPVAAENCFRQHPLSFAEPRTHTIQWVNGTTVTIPAKQTQIGTMPAGSQWRRNPIPSLEFCGLTYCKCPEGWTQGQQCPAFEPPCPGCWGGVVDSAGGVSNSLAEDFSVLDDVIVPDVPDGDYTLQWRWDTESLPYQQVWTNCADITIKAKQGTVLV